MNANKNFNLYFDLLNLHIGLSNETIDLDDLKIKLATMIQDYFNITEAREHILKLIEENKELKQKLNINDNNLKNLNEENI